MLDFLTNFVLSISVFTVFLRPSCLSAFQLFQKSCRSFSLSCFRSGASFSSFSLSGLSAYHSLSVSVNQAVDQLVSQLYFRPFRSFRCLSLCSRSVSNSQSVLQVLQNFVHQSVGLSVFRVFQSLSLRQTVSHPASQPVSQSVS